jgi:transcriptional regulator with XRE-family HTH domain
MPSARATEIQRSIAANIRRWRARRDLTQEALAEKAELGAVHVRSIERGVENITVATLIAIADALDVPPGRLLRAARLPELKPGRPRKRRSPGA